MGLRVVHHVSSERATVVSVRDAKSASSTPAVRRVMAARDMVIGTISGTDSVHARTRRSSLVISVSLGSGGLRVEGGRLTHMAAILGGMSMRVMMVGVMIGACATTPRQDLVPPLPGPASNARFTAEDMQRETWVERFENPKREVFSKRAAVVEAMQLAPGATVADIGAGTGAYLDVLVDAVGPDGVVVATELSEGFRKGLSDRADAAGWSQVRVRPSRADHCGLDDASVDSALLVDVYHHLDAPVPFVQDLARAITPGGTLVVVDFDPGKPEATEWVKDHVYLTADEMVAQVVGTGLFTLLDRPDVGLVDNAMVRFTRVGSR